jgi:pilus assembly protein TadC
MTAQLIGVFAALTLAALILAALSSRSDIARRIMAIDTSAQQRGKNENQFLKHFVGDASQGDLRSKLVEAGWYKTTVAAFYVRSGLSVGVAISFALLLVLEMHEFSTTLIVVAMLFGTCGLLLPRAILNRTIAKRKTAIHRMMPDWLDTVSTTVEAGTALNAALAMSLDAIRGPLADELREVLADVRIGRSRADALTAMAQRVKQVDLTSTVTAMVQTERLGGNIGHGLDELAAAARHRRLLRAEELAAQLPVKMVIPMALFMLPALMVMIFGPVVADLMTKAK